MLMNQMKTQVAEQSLARVASLTTSLSQSEEVEALLRRDSRSIRGKQVLTLRLL